MRYRAHHSSGESPCGFEVNTLTKKGGRKTRKIQRPKSPARIDIFAAALYWAVKTILLLVDWFTR